MLRNCMRQRGNLLRPESHFISQRRKGSSYKYETTSIYPRDSLGNHSMRRRKVHVIVHGK